LLRAPRTEPYVRLSRIRLPPRMSDDKAFVALCRTRASAWVTRSRLKVRCVLCRLAFSSAPALGSIASSTARAASFDDFAATMAGSDCLRPFIVGYGSSPSQRGPACTPRSETSSPRFRHDPFVRDEVCDHGRVTAPRVTALLMLPSALSTASASAFELLFRGSIAHPAQLLCTLRDGRHLPPRNTRYRADATPYPGRTFTGWIAPTSWRTDSGNVSLALHEAQTQTAAARSAGIHLTGWGTLPLSPDLPVMGGGVLSMRFRTSSRLLCYIDYSFEMSVGHFFS
jgi:hypothetical protein